LFAWSCDIISFSAYVVLCWSSTIMSSMYHEVLGSFADVPAVIHVNGASLDSTVSLSVLHNFNVLCSICNHDGVAVESSSGPVRVPTVDSWYNSRQIFRSIYLKGCDVELGCDWLAFVNARFDGSRFLWPLETDLVRLCAGHTWNFEAGGMCACPYRFHIAEMICSLFCLLFSYPSGFIICYPSGFIICYPSGFIFIICY